MAKMGPNMGSCEYVFGFHRLRADRTFWKVVLQQDGTVVQHPLWSVGFCSSKNLSQVPRVHENDVQIIRAKAVKPDRLELTVQTRFVS
jgi:hypothetical protein